MKRNFDPKFVLKISNNDFILASFQGHPFIFLNKDNDPFSLPIIQTSPMVDRDGKVSYPYDYTLLSKLNNDCCYISEKSIYTPLYGSFEILDSKLDNYGIIPFLTGNPISMKHSSDLEWFSSIVSKYRCQKYFNDAPVWVIPDKNCLLSILNMDKESIQSSLINHAARFDNNELISTEDYNITSMVEDNLINRVDYNELIVFKIKNVLLSDKLTVCLDERVSFDEIPKLCEYCNSYIKDYHDKRKGSYINKLQECMEKISRLDAKEMEIKKKDIDRLITRINSIYYVSGPNSS